MDILLKKSLIAEEMNKIDFGGDHKISTDSNISKEHNTYTSERSSTDTASLPSSPISKEFTSKEQDDELESTRAEMVQVRSENEKLKMILARILEDYQSLQMKFLDIVRNDPSSKEKFDDPASVASEQIVEEESDLVSLTLGTATNKISNPVKEDKENSSSKRENDGGNMGGGLTLGLDCKFEGSSSVSTQPATKISPENSWEEAKENDGEEQAPPNKLLKTAVEDEVSQQIQIKKARVSVRTRCDGPTMNDGCQWRKYGQKISKGNPCPRAYYRCTVAPACPVRKQVQRCAEDMSILITTYEGTHNHPLSMAATAMASTTSAAASMLLTGSSSSQPNIISSPFATGTAAFHSPSSSFQGLNFNIYDSSKFTKPYFFPSTHPFSTAPTHPTITLDLTSPSPSSTVTTAIPSTQLNRFSSPFASSIPRYPTSLSFSSMDTNPAPSPWNQLHNNKSMQVGSLYQSSYVSKNTNNLTTTSQTQQAFTDSIAKAITSDPSFKSALAAAITSIVGGQATEGVGGQLSGLSTLSGTASVSNQPVQNRGSSTFLQPAFGLLNHMGASSTLEKRDNIN